MLNSFIRYAFLPVTLSTVAAGCTANFAEVLEDYKKQSNLTYTDCGKANSPWKCDDATLFTQPDKVKACLLDAFGSCKAAQATFNSSTTEGDSITEVYFVAPDGKGGCKLDIFTDNTQDSYSDRKVSREECTTVPALYCESFRESGCTQLERY